MKTITARFVSFFLIVIFLLFPLMTVQAIPAVTDQQSPSTLIIGDSTVNSLFNTNLVPDGDAELDYSPWWIDNEGFTQILPYGYSCGGMCNFPSPYDEGPVLRGTNFFYMGSTDDFNHGTNLWIKNKISLDSIQEAIDTGKVRYILSGYFGGDTDSPNTAQFHLFFEPESGPNIGEVIVGNVTPEERQKIGRAHV